MKSRRKQKCTKVVLFVIAFFFATSFLMPIVLTVANSFMQESEISANYGAVFDSYTDDSNNYYNGNQQQTKSSYTSEAANLKFIPDMVTFKQYYTVLLQSPDYLLKFWNSIILVVPIVVFQIFIALGAAYSFSRFRGRKKEIICQLLFVLFLENNLVVIRKPQFALGYILYVLVALHILLQTLYLV